ncbi:hypothetical protein SAMN05446935_2553 [Burkholderia sp. YR290]|nr:hypothetical protein SAMN05446935_2553 [Burkholderia sp. YR290]
MRHSADTRRLNSEYVAPYGNQRRRMAFRMSQIGRASDVRGPTLKGWNASIRAGRRRAQFVKGYSMPAIDHRNVTVPLRVLAGVE